MYLKVWRRRVQFDAGNGHAIGWMARIARNIAVDGVRHRVRHPLLSVNDLDEDAYDGLASTEAQPPDLLMLARGRAAVRASLAALRSEQSQSLHMAFYEGLSHRQIAQAMGLPLGSVKSCLRRSLVQLRQSMSGHQWIHAEQHNGTRTHDTDQDHHHRRPERALRRRACKTPPTRMNASFSG